MGKGMGRGPEVPVPRARSSPVPRGAALDYRCKCLKSRRSEAFSVRPGGFEPPTNGLEGRGGHLLELLLPHGAALLRTPEALPPTADPGAEFNGRQHHENECQHSDGGGESEEGRGHSLPYNDASPAAGTATQTREGALQRPRRELLRGASAVATSVEEGAPKPTRPSEPSPNRRPRSPTGRRRARARQPRARELLADVLPSKVYTHPEARHRLNGDSIYRAMRREWDQLP
jgi:hypothetical protein